jgi:hypothetical protein
VIDGGPLAFNVFNSELFNSCTFNQEKPPMNLTDAIAAAQAAKKALNGADGDVATEAADVLAEQAILDAKQKALDDAKVADAAAKDAYKSSLSDLIASANAELSGL